MALDCLQSISFLFLYRNNTRKRHGIRTRNLDENSEKDWDEQPRSQGLSEGHWEREETVSLKSVFV